MSRKGIAPGARLRHNAASLPGRRAHERGLPGRPLGCGRERTALLPWTRGRRDTTTPVASSSKSISAKRQRQILVVLLAAFSLLSAASLATYHVAEPFYSGANACGPVGATLAFGLVVVFGRVAAFLVPTLCMLWAWNRFHEHDMKPLVLQSALGSLMLLELCAMAGLGNLDRTNFAGGWGAATALALHGALGSVGSWLVAGTLFAATALVASEMGFHWIAALAHGALVKPAQAAVAGYAGWRESRAEAAAALHRIDELHAPQGPTQTRGLLPHERARRRLRTQRRSGRTPLAERVRRARASHVGP